MSLKDAQRVRTSEAHAEGVEPGGMGPRDAMRRSLFGMTYAQQVEAVRPPVAVRGAVQFQSETGAQPIHSRSSAEQRTVPPRIAHLLSEDEWTELWGLSHPEGAMRPVDAAALATLERLVELVGPRLEHSEISGALPDFKDPDRPLAANPVGGLSDEWWVDGCHESAFIIQEAAQALGITTNVIYMGSHRTASFPAFGLALFHGDDLHSGVPFELVPLGVVGTYWRQAADLALMGSMLPQPDDPLFVRLLFLDALSNDPVEVPGVGGQVFQVTHHQWLEQVPDAVLAAIVVRQEVNLSVRRELALGDLRSRLLPIVQALAEELVALGQLVPSTDGRVPCSEEGVLLYVLPDGRLPETPDQAVGVLARRVEAFGIQGAMAGELIPDAAQRSAVREAARESPE